ncbi:MAG: class II aldolase/adducin family protein [Chloroflexi bacterium]|jgi:L-fuculose-phosphate aldolase|nr:class II aldolase/adducin family protein [Chloroflexota bacterium]MBT5627403.1 class II aldolase/adducin family protein [Chloroflexota bacterium]
MNWQNERQKLVDTMQKLDRLGMVSGSSGNASVRLPAAGTKKKLFLVTPAGVSYDTLTIDQIVLVDEEMSPIGRDAGIPSSEALLHKAVYDSRRDVDAIIHTHSVYASVQAVKAEAIPPIIDEMVVYIGGTIEVSEYGFPGTVELAEKSVEALGDRRAAIIRNHGMFAVADSLKEALRVAELVERIAKIYVNAKTSGTIVPVPDHAVEAEREMYLKRTGLKLA